MARSDDGGEEVEARAPTLGDRIEYAFVRLLTFPLLCTDLRGAARIGRALGRLLGAVDRRHRRVAEDNLRRAFGPSLPESEVRRISGRVYENLGVTAAEVIHGPRRIRGRAARRWFRAEGEGPARAAAQRGPILFLSAHFGNWEHIIPAVRAHGLEILTVARPLDNPCLDRWVTGIRHAVGHFSLEKAGALRGLVRALREGRHVGMLADQNGGRHGALSTFFGRPVSTQAAGISLARRLKVPYCVGVLERRAPGFHLLRVDPPVYVRDDDDGEREAVDDLNRRLERFIRARPEEWMWLHRRWRIKADWGFPVEPTEGKGTGGGGGGAR
jgi:KDO2-lipid IV(A) lauroyltransferase